MSDYQPGELVDITIKGARVIHTVTADGELPVTFDSEQGLYPLTVPLGDPLITVAHRAPAEWPPRPGDLWRSADGTPYFGVAYCPDYDNREDSKGINSEGWRTVLLSHAQDDSCTPGAAWTRPEQVLQQHGPLTLVHREPEQDGGS